MWLKLAVRDLLLLAAFAALWWWAAPLSAGDGFVADFLGLAAGLGLGVGHYLLHEWGHALGGLATRSVIRPAASLRSRFLFSFDSQENSRAQFLAMSFSGFAVTGVVLWAVYTQLPDVWLATRVARGAVLFLVALTVFIEFPLVIYALVRNRVPPVETVDNPLRRKKDETEPAAA
jgi:hypothetical protein